MHNKTAPNAPSWNNSTQRSSADGPKEKPKRRVEIDFCELPDGRLLEMIVNPGDATDCLLAISTNGRIRYAQKLRYRNQVFVPIPRETEIIRHVHLAKGAESYKSLEILLADIRVVLMKTLELTFKQIILLSQFILTTWLIDKLPVAPYVAFVGPPGSGKTTALRILNLLCRRSLLTSDISSSAFYSVCDRMTTTLLLDETATVDNRRQLLHLLRAGTTQDSVAVRKGNTYKTYGARAFSWLELPDDDALNSRCLIIPMTSCKAVNLLTPDDPRILYHAEKLQRQLLQFRLASYRTLRIPKIPGEEALRPRTRDLLRALAMPVADDKRICEVLLSLLKQQQPLGELLSVSQSTVLDLLYDTIHDNPEVNYITISELTRCANENLREKGEPGKILEKKLGNILTSLHLTNRTRRNDGFVLWVDRKTREQIHQLVRAYGPTPKMSPACEMCRLMSTRPTSDATTGPHIKSDGVGTRGSRERGELRERGKPRARRKAS